MSHVFPLCHKKRNTRKCVKNEPATNEPGEKRTQPLETPQGKEQMSRTRIAKSVQKKEQQMSELQKIRIKLKAYDHALLDQSAAKIVETAKKTGAKMIIIQYSYVEILHQLFYNRCATKTTTRM